jgi:broad specificity phosphatase PhoE
VSGKIVLVRHGRSAHVVTGFLDVAAFRKWRESYEAAGIDPTDRAPAPLSAAAQQAVILASDSQRAIDSARLLAPDREVLVSPLLRELSLDPPNVPFRLPMSGWALAYGVRWLLRPHHHIKPEEIERARDVAKWLIRTSQEAGSVIVVTHASFRSLVAKELRNRGWTCALPRRRSRHWSAWSFE